MLCYYVTANNSRRRSSRKNSESQDESAQSSAQSTPKRGTDIICRHNTHTHTHTFTVGTIEVIICAVCSEYETTAINHAWRNIY